MDIIKLSDIKKNLPFQISKGMYNGNLIEWKNYNYLDHYILDFDVYLPTKGINLQRGFCWTLEQKRDLIMSVIKGINIPNITVIISEEENGIQRKVKVIDGKQRLSTLIDFINDKFSIILLGKEYRHSELPSYDKDYRNNIKYAIDSFNILFDQAYEYYDKPISDDDKITWFELINFAGTIQDVEHLKKLKSGK